LTCDENPSFQILIGVDGFMVRARFSLGENRGTRLGLYVILAAVLIVAVGNAPTPLARWATIALLAIFGALQALASTVSHPEAPHWPAHLCVAAQTAVTTALMYLSDDWSLFAILFFILSIQVALLFPPRPAATWIAVMTAISTAFGIAKWGWPGGLVALPLYGGGYTMSAVFANSLVRAETARRESQALVEELQIAQGKMQEYAGRIEELAVVEERSRLAREMHDTLGHRLTVAAVQLEGAQRLIEADPDRAAQMVGTVREQVREALAELRQTVTALRAPVEADLSLPHALARLAAHFEQATGITVHRVLPRAEELPDLPATHRLAVYRAAQEALTNVQRHAEAGQVWLVLADTGGAVTLLVGDDGKGISLSGDQAGLGLHGLRERAAQLGGEMHVEPRRGGGTQVSFRLPVESSQQSAELLTPESSSELTADG
jgi:signal transduction histidine kinase